MNDSFVEVPSGPFIYGPEECYERLEFCPPLKPQLTIDLPEFWIATSPVTYLEWRSFLEATGYKWSGQWY
ncbi:MAG TPA: SUMF1/EgtB/PvdO family nonheme iron enzyme, partial [Anaerolineae bacterium]|nr:SUMF1/EgtB/PvdO family nonheme iron enzyme [Anaerolineae bacterium]